MSKSYTICGYCNKINRFDTERASTAVCAHCKKPLAIQGPTVDVDDGKLGEFIARSPVPVIVDFWAPWCGPCLAFAPTFAQVATTNAGHAVFLKLNTENHPAPSARLGVRGIPTVMIFSNGQEVARRSGAMDARSFAGWIGGFTKKV
ncbi:MAG: thioredoxin TrxC [Deltaproteobacteria bacterium]|nr:thioredoxin TrxC [Deltaproteobacteria bacterium]